MTIRIDSELKGEAAKVVEDYGLDLSSVVRAFFVEIVSTNAIPLSLDYRRPSVESLEAIRETEEMIAKDTGESYRSGADLLKTAMA
nr:type II toxin-antitoxin system RelB/DinJ family antitoxin [Collinsella urealyticum]